MSPSVIRRNYRWYGPGGDRDGHACGGAEGIDAWIGRLNPVYTGKIGGDFWFGPGERNSLGRATVYI